MDTWRDFIELFLRVMSDHWCEEFDKEQWDKYFELALQKETPSLAAGVADAAEREWRDKVDVDARTQAVLLLERIMPELVKEIEADMPVVYTAPDGKKYKLVEVS